MPFVLIFVGILLVVSGAKATQNELGKQLIKDFTGAGNFVYWIVSIMIVGSIGYIPKLKNFSQVFIGLILMALILSNGKNGLFQKFTQALQSLKSPGAEKVVDTSQVAVPVSKADSGIGSIVGGLVDSYLGGI